MSATDDDEAPELQLVFYLFPLDGSPPVQLSVQDNYLDVLSKDWPPWLKESRSMQSEHIRGGDCIYTLIYDKILQTLPMCPINKCWERLARSSTGADPVQTQKGPLILFTDRLLDVDHFGKVVAAHYHCKLANAKSYVYSHAEMEQQ